MLVYICISGFTVYEYSLLNVVCGLGVWACVCLNLLRMKTIDAAQDWYFFFVFIVVAGHKILRTSGLMQAGKFLVCC